MVCFEGLCALTICVLMHRSRGESAVFVLDAETSECLHYEPTTGYPPKKYAKIPREILKDHPEVEIRNDLIDCCIDVCSVEVGYLGRLLRGSQLSS